MPNQMKNKNLDKMPLVAYLGFSIHGDEASGAEAAVLLLHHLAAGQGDEIDQILRNVQGIYKKNGCLNAEIRCR